MPFNLNFRKILIILGFIIVIAGISFALYFAFFRPTSSIQEEPISEPVSGGGGLPLAGIIGERPTRSGEETTTINKFTGGLLNIKDLTLSSANNISFDSNNNNLQFYDSASGLFYKVDYSGAPVPLSNKQFFQVDNVTWSESSNEAVLEYPDGSNIVYNFDTGKQTTLPKHWQDFQFSSDGNKIISKSISTDVDNRWLIISDKDGTNSKIITALGENADKVQVAWSPNGNVVGFSDTGDPTSQFDTQEIFLLGQNNENFRSLKIKGFDFKAKWANEGDRILYSVTDSTNNYYPTLYTTDVSGDNVGTNTVPIQLNTWVDKCTILDGYKAYCAVPKTLEDGAGLEPRVADNSDDLIYFVNLKTGATNFIAEPDGDYSISQISVSNDENYIYFTDRLTGTLHQMKIK